MPGRVCEIPGYFYRVFLRAAESRTPGPVIGLQYGEEDGAEEVISRGGGLRVQNRDLSHFTEWRSEPLVD